MNRAISYSPAAQRRKERDAQRSLARTQERRWMLARTFLAGFCCTLIPLLILFA